MVRYQKSNFSHTCLNSSIRSWLWLRIPREENPWKQETFIKCQQGETHRGINKQKQSSDYYFEEGIGASTACLLGIYQSSWEKEIRHELPFSPWFTHCTYFTITAPLTHFSIHLSAHASLWTPHPLWYCQAQHNAWHAAGVLVKSDKLINEHREKP